MSDSKKNPKIPPPDDFSKTVPNVNIPLDDDSSDWDKTQYGLPSEAPADDWGKTVINYDISSDNGDDDDVDFNKTHYENNSPKEPDWGMTQAVNINNDFGRNDVDDNDFGKSDENDYGATTPYFKLPEADRAKYQNLPPTPTEQAKKEKEEEKKKGGIPMWFWATAALMTMFTFALIILIGGYFIFFNKTGFEIQVKGAVPGSQVIVDNDVIWGVSDDQGEIRLTNLKAGTRNITIRKQGYSDDNHRVKGEDGDIEPVFAKQSKSAPPPSDCGEIKKGEIAKAEECAGKALDNLGNPPDLDELLKALNLYYINFESGQHTIPSARMRFLERASTYIKQLPSSVQIEIGGHTDNVGSDSNNQALSERRANSVKQALVKFGVNESMLTTKGYGESSPRPGNTNSTEDEKFQNRRIEYKAVKR